MIVASYNSFNCYRTHGMISFGSISAVRDDLYDYDKVCGELKVCPSRQVIGVCSFVLPSQPTSMPADRVLLL